MMIVIQIVICIILYSVCGQVDSYTQVRVVGKGFGILFIFGIFLEKFRNGKNSKPFPA